MCEAGFTLPVLRPLPIKTAGKPWCKRVWSWIASTRRWELMEDWYYVLPPGCPMGLGGHRIMVPKGFIHDGASIPKPFRMILSPTGIMLIAGIVHDYIYKTRTLLSALDGKPAITNLTRAVADKVFACVNHSVNELNVLGGIAYWALRAGGMFAWNGHRKREGN